MADDIVINFADYVKELRSLAYHRGDNFLYGAAGFIEAQQAEIERLTAEVNDLRLQVVALSTPKEARRG